MNSWWPQQQLIIFRRKDQNIYFSPEPHALNTAVYKACMIKINIVRSECLLFLSRMLLMGCIRNLNIQLLNTINNDHLIRDSHIFIFQRTGLHISQREVKLGENRRCNAKPLPFRLFLILNIFVGICLVTCHDVLGYSCL